MIPNRFNIVTDGQWGSTGKGLITTALASIHKPEILSTTNMANAGHTAVWDSDRKFIAKALPSAAALKTWMDDYNPTIVIGPSAALHIDQLLKEIDETKTEDLIIHPRSGVITKDHQTSECDLDSGTKHIASTMQGCGAFLADKIMRRKELKLARDYDELDKYVYKGDSLPQTLYNRIMYEDHTMLHEGSQGFSLDINHGSHYPNCTSRGTTAIQNVADMGLPLHCVGDIYLVIRPYPIRVGNVVENDKVVGHSGGCYDDHEEMTWEQIMADSGAPESIANNICKTELTTVTKRLRRAFGFSNKQLKQAVLSNGATKIALNFANYIDWSCYQCNEYEKLPTKVMDFIHMVEDNAGIPVSVVGTGPNNNDICVL